MEGRNIGYRIGYRSRHFVNWVNDTFYPTIEEAVADKKKLQPQYKQTLFVELDYE